jgi:hypothetical protein
MTNKDLMDTLSKFGEKGTKSTKKDDKQPPELEIYGPRTSKIEPKPASKTDGKSGPSGDDTNVYPDIYGPEITSVPGTKCKSGKHQSDCVDDNDAYQFNPDLQKAFPGGGDPQPFLTDFSKFQH